MLSTAEIPQEIVKYTWDQVLAPHVWVFYGSFAVAFIFTPIMRSIAMYYGIIDEPDNLRKMHSTPVAYLGGVAVFMGWIFGLAVSQLHLGQLDSAPTHLHIQLSIVGGAAATLLLGLWDDIKGLRPLFKILGQVCAALLLLSQPGVVDHCMVPVIQPLNERFVHLLGPSFYIPDAFILIASKLLVICMVVGCCNATNLMDGLDGLCGGVTAFIAAGFLFLAVHVAMLGLNPDLDPVRIVLALALLGAVLGFVPYNFNPASIFMGDAGSMFLGYACATMILTLSQNQSRWFLAATVMFALPVLDTSLAFARRWVNGRPLFSADRNHFHHQLVNRGLTIRKTVLISYGLAIGFCILGGLIVYLKTRYAIAIYMVTFGSIIVAAYKMGMVHEKLRIVTRRGLDAGNAAAPSEIAFEPASVIEIQDSPETARPGQQTRSNATLA